MTTLEDQVRHALHDLANDVQPVHFLSRLDRVEARAHHTPTRRRMAVVAAAVVAAVATASVILLRLDRPSIIEPVQRPPKVFRLSDLTSVMPGRALMTLTLARPYLGAPGGEQAEPLYVLPSTGRPAVHVPGSDRVPYSWSKELSTDGTLLIRQYANYLEPRLELVDLRTGRADDLGGRLGYCPKLSPDNRTVAAYSESDVHVFGSSSGTPRSLHQAKVTEDFPCHGLGWSPDGRQLVVRTGIRTGSVVLDRQGRVQLDLPDLYAVNASMSWSPDGRRLLMYDLPGGEYDVVPTAGGDPVVMHRPTDALRPIGWAGPRVVWLAGQPGDYRLVTTDQRGEDVRTWMRFDIGDRQIVDVSWSRDLSGTARD